MAPATVANPTDPDSGIMKGPHCSLQGLSAQCVISSSQIILVKCVTADANDRRQLVPALLMCIAVHGKLTGKPTPLGVVLADAGYCSADAVTIWNLL